jgi:hypothetical protein
MNLLFFNRSNNKKKKPLVSRRQESYPTLSSLSQKTSEETTKHQEEEGALEAIDENFFYKHLLTHFHSLFCESTIVCIPHSKSIQGLVITKDIIGKNKINCTLIILTNLCIESHCFQPSPYFCGQYMATKQKQKIISLDYPIITTGLGIMKFFIKLFLLTLY